MSAEWWAFGTLVGLLLLIHLVRVLGWNATRRQAPASAKPPPGSSPHFIDLLIGSDNRVSTSKTMAVAWTLVVAFMLITIGYVALGGTAVTLPGTLTPTNEIYLVFLGGPYAAAVLAKVAVASQVNNGTLQKSQGTPSPMDVVADDSGATDVYDLQYTLFNLIAIILVLSQFLPHPAVGLPGVPDFLAFLTGGSALTYTLNKAAGGQNGAALAALVPSTARVGDQVRAFGQNLAAPAANQASIKQATTLTVGGASATVSDVAADHVIFEVPHSPTGSWPTSGQDVQLKTNAGDLATLAGALTIIGTVPRIDVVEPDPVSAGGPQFKIRGAWFFTVAPQPKAAEPVSVSLVVSNAALSCPVQGNAEDGQVVVAVPPDLRRLVDGGAQTGTVVLTRQDNATSRKNVAVGP
jgi:hypothetical protein